MSSEWVKIKIEDIADVKSGKRLPQGHELIDEKTSFPYIRLVDVSNGKIKKADLKFLKPETREHIKRYIVKSHDVCLAIVGHTIGMVFYVDSEWDDVNLTENAARLTNFNEKINSRYLYYYLTSGQGQADIISRKVGSAQGKLPLYNIKSLEFLAPSIIEQNTIVQLLDSLSLRIDLLRETNTTLESIAQALFKSWFVDFDPVHANAGTQAPSLPPEIQSLFPSTFVESSLGLVPEGWGVGKVEDVMELAYGKALKASDRSHGDVPVYGSGGITGCHSESLVNGPSIIVGRKGTVGTLYWEDRAFFPIDTVFYVKPKLSLCFCYYLLKSLPLADMNTDAAVPGLNRNNVYRLEVVIPPEKILMDFDQTVSLLRGSIFSNDQKIQHLSALRDTLLPRLISGQLRLPEVERLAEAAL
jgi:type I restriction enzyme S subunit